MLPPAALPPPEVPVFEVPAFVAPVFCAAPPVFESSVVFAPSSDWEASAEAPADAALLAGPHGLRTGVVPAAGGEGESEYRGEGAESSSVLAVTDRAHGVLPG